MKRRVTLQDIADLVGVSKATVDRAVHKRGEINKITEQKILNAIKELNYRPNRIARTLSVNCNKTIGVIIRNEPAFFWNDVKKGIIDAGNEIEDYGIEVIIKGIQKSEDTAEDQLNYIDEICKQKIDVLVLVPRNTPELNNKIRELVKKGIIVVTLNDDIETHDRLFYIGPDILRSGRVAADLMGKFLNRKGNVITIKASGKSLTYDRRLQSFTEVINERFPDIRIISSYTYDGTKSLSYQREIIKSMLVNIPDLRGIYDVDGATLHEVGDLIKSCNHLNDIVLIGHEIWDNIETLLEEDIISATIVQDPYAQGYYAIKLLYEYLIDGKKPEFSKLYTRLEIITRENIRKSKNTINHEHEIVSNNLKQELYSYKQ